MNEPNTLLANIEQQIREAELSAGIGMLDQVLALQGQVDDRELQLAYIRSIIFLVGKNPADSVLNDLYERLQKTPAYAQDEKLVEEHGKALVEASGKSPDHHSSLQRARAIQTLKGYGASKALQAAHAEALLKASEKPGAKIFDLAGEVSQIPSFRDSVEIQFVAARMLCDYNGQAAGLRELNQAIDDLQALPLLPEEPRLQESLERAKRNRERFFELEPVAATGSSSWKRLAVGGGVLGVLLVGGWALSSSDKSEPVAVAVTPSATPAQADTLSIERDELAKYLSKSTEAYEKKDFENSGVYAGMALKRAEALNDEQSLAQCYDLLASSYLYKGETAQISLLEKIPASSVPAIAESHLEAAQSHHQNNQLDSLKVELAILSHLAEQSKDGKLDPTVEKAYLLCEERKLWALGGAMQLHLGHLDKAADLIERSQDLELAKKLLAKTTNSGKFKSTASGKEVSAKAHTVLAKAEYLDGHYKAALEHAEAAYQDAPNADRKERLAAYKFKDASVVTLDELQVDSFIFPPAEKTGEYYTYFYILRRDRAGASQETVLQPPNDEIQTTVVYGAPENGIAVAAEAYTGGGFLAAFDGDQQRAIAPGLYEDATIYPYNNNNPGMDFNENGSGYGRRVGKFKVHEIKYQGDELSALALDFIFDRDGKSPNPVFGKIRYNSHFK